MCCKCKPQIDLNYTSWRYTTITNPSAKVHWSPRHRSSFNNAGTVIWLTQWLSKVQHQLSCHPCLRQRHRLLLSLPSSSSSWLHALMSMTPVNSGYITDGQTTHHNGSIPHPSIETNSGLKSNDVLTQLWTAEQNQAILYCFMSKLSKVWVSKSVIVYSCYWTMQNTWYANTEDFESLEHNTLV